MTLHKKYPIHLNWNRDYYLGMILEWNSYHKIYSEKNVWLSIPGYVKEAFIKFKYHFINQQFSASLFRDPTYGSKVQHTDVIETQLFTKIQVHLLQRICWKFLYYARSIDSTMIHEINNLASQITIGTIEHQCFLNYCETNLGHLVSTTQVTWSSEETRMQPTF